MGAVAATMGSSTIVIVAGVTANRFVMVDVSCDDDDDDDDDCSAERHDDEGWMRSGVVKNEGTPTRMDWTVGFFVVLGWQEEAEG